MQGPLPVRDSRGVKKLRKVVTAGIWPQLKRKQ